MLCLGEDFQDLFIIIKNFGKFKLTIQANFLKQIYFASYKGKYIYKIKNKGIYTP